jgi:hypothetical protein
MDVSSQEFSEKSASQRVAVLARSNPWFLIGGIAAFVASIMSITALYVSNFDARHRQQETLLRFDQMQVALKNQSMSLQDTIDKIAQSASQISDAQQRENILQQTRELQRQIFDFTATVLSSYRSNSSNEINHRYSLSFPLFSQAFAQAATPPAVSPPPTAAPPPPVAAPPTFGGMTQESARLYVMMSVFIVLGITFIVSVVAVFVATNSDVLKFAFDTVKTLMGFFIGVATAFLGLPATPH